MTTGNRDAGREAGGRAAMWRPAIGGLWLVAIALAIDAITGFGHRLALTHWFGQLMSMGFEDSQGLLDDMTFYDRLSSIVSVAVEVMVVIGLGKMAQAPNAVARRIATVGAGLFAIALLVDMAFLIESFQDRPIGWLDSRPLIIAIIVEGGLAFAALLYYLSRVAGQIGARLPSWMVAITAAWLLWRVGYPVARIVDPSLALGAPNSWGYAVGLGGLQLGGLTLLVIMAARVARALGRGVGATVDAEGAHHLISTGWQTPADGLALYGDALAWRLGLALGGYGLLFLAIAGKSIGLIKLVSWALPVAMSITGLMMLVGVYRFSQQPDRSPGRGPAYGGFAAMLIGTALEAYSFVLIVQALLADPKSYRAYEAAQQAAAQAGRLSVWAMALGFAGLISILVAFAGVVRYVGREQLVPRVVNVAILLFTAAVIVVGCRIYITDAPIAPKGVVLMGLVVAVYSLVAVVLYLRLTRAVERAIREAVAGGRDELPGARVISGS